jgi:SAM-dependent methyltransferase
MYSQANDRRILTRFAEQVRHRFYTWYCERKYGVSTRGFIEPHELGIGNPDAMAHSPLGYEYIEWGLATIPFPPAEVVFLDYGAGKGRALIAAAARPFHKVVGVEISEGLTEAARRNLARMKHRRAAYVEVHLSDAALFPVPDDANVIFFFNPFAGETLTEVVRRIRQSYCSHPRDLFVIFFNHREFDERVEGQQQFDGQQWLRKVHETSFCGLYRSV